MFQFKSIYERIKVYLISLGIVFLILFCILQYLKVNQEKKIMDLSQQQFSKDVNSVVSVNSENMMKAIKDYTYWDEFIIAINKRDSKWLESNITVTNSFDYDYVAVYNARKELVFQNTGKDSKLNAIIPEEAITSLNRTRFAHFFLKTEGGLKEVAAGSIHPTNDPEHNKTEPSGYMFIVKNWDQKFINQMAIVCASKINVINTFDSIPYIKDKTIYVKRDFADWDKNHVCRIVFSKATDFNFDYTRNMMYLTFFITILALIITNSFARKHIHRPLKLVTQILKTESYDSIFDLKSSPAEFGRIGFLFEEYIEQKKALKNAKEKAEESDRLKSAFLANMSHEIRTPMNGILGFISLLKEPILSGEEHQEYVNIIESSGVRMLNILNDIVEMSRIESGQMKVSITETNINEQLKFIHDFFKPEVERKGMQLHLKNGLQEKEGSIKTDREKLYSVLTNLVKNAIKYSEKGSIEIGYVKKDKFLEVFVKDTGIGIAREQHSKVFERFIQAEKGKRAFQGAGLGLAISKAYIEMLGGQIWVESELGEGSSFYFTVPYDEIG